MDQVQWWAYRHTNSPISIHIERHVQPAVAQHLPPEQRFTTATLLHVLNNHLQRQRDLAQTLEGTEEPA